MSYSYKEFIAGDFEAKINKKSLYYNYIMPYDEILKYIRDILKIPIDCIVNDIKNSSEDLELTAKDIMQFSNFNDASIRMCKILSEIENPGVTYIQAGRLLLNDGQQRKDGAYTKYGENHLKTSAIVGLTFELTNTYFLSSIGHVIELLSDEEIDRIIVRLLLRGKLVKRLIRASFNGQVDVRQMLYMLSDSTYIRRRSNIKKIFNVLQNSTEYDFSMIINNLVW